MDPKYLVIIGAVFVVIAGISLGIYVMVFQRHQLIYPFEDRNMFFGLTILKDARDYALANEPNVSWISMQPIVLWAAIEKSPNQYDWSEIDSQVARIQNIGLDCTMVLMPMCASEAEKEEIRQKMGSSDFQGFLRSPQSATMKLYPHGQDEVTAWKNFVRTMVERYDGDGKNDFPGLRFPVRNWHFLEEYPMIWIPDAATYVDLLKETYAAVKGEDPQAKVILPGLAGNYARIFAYVTGFINDSDAGVWNGVRLARTQLAANPIVKNEMGDFKSILKDGKGYYDIVDIHLYEEKETFAEGKVKWMQSALVEYGVSAPIWCIEGGGPFKLREGQQSNYGDAYYGYYTDRENAEFVVKLHVIAAVNKVERYHWGLMSETEDSFWNGPWCNMGLVSADRQKKPSFYTFKILAGELGDFTDARDLSVGDIRLYEFTVKGRKVYVSWLRVIAGSEAVNLRDLLPQKPASVRVSFIVTELGVDGGPVLQSSITVQTDAVPLDSTPVFLELVD